jgi:hypothetical protein
MYNGKAVLRILEGMQKLQAKISYAQNDAMICLRSVYPGWSKLQVENASFAFLL